ncbi:MAG: hypothetical protein HYY03_08620 [Chloroflexi bacterium]|nr:hypothetical protein [Chloroflexota bacterium]
MAAAAVLPTAVPLEVERIVAYIERCRTPDGGYFFARVPPAGAADTYHAVEALRLLGRKPRRIESLARWVGAAVTGETSRRPYGLYYLAKLAAALSLPGAALRRSAARLSRSANFVAMSSSRPLYVEVPSDLEAAHLLLESCIDLGVEGDRARLAESVLAFRNHDGGFGSTLASTYYAVVTLARLGVEGWPVQSTVSWLKGREAAGGIQYMEGLRWLSGALEALGEGIDERQKALDFVRACQRPSGGFARARVGIATLEYTHYALEVLRSLGRLA